MNNFILKILKIITLDIKYRAVYITSYENMFDYCT